MMPRRNQHGFTFVEMMIVVVLIGLMTAGVSLSIGATSRVKLRSSCWTLMAAVRYAYSRAVTQGTTTRLVLDFEGRSIKIEETKGRVVLNRDDETGEGVKHSAEDEEELAKGDGSGAKEEKFLDFNGSSSGAAGSASSTGPMSMAMGAFGGGSGLDMTTMMENLAADVQSGAVTFTANAKGYESPPFKALPGKRGQARALEGDTIFKKVYTPHEPTPREDGRAYIYFFSSGMTEHTFVQISDGEDRVFTVEIHPLSGKTFFYNEEREPTIPLDDLQEADE